MTFLETEEDINYLNTKKVELFARNHHSCKPTVMIRDSEGNLIVEKFGAQKDSLS